MKLLISIAVLAALGAIFGGVWVGAHVREDTVVARPYEEGVRREALLAEASRLRWTVVAPAGLGAGAPLAFEVRDGEGRPLDGADVSLVVSRPATGRGQLTVAARAAGAPGAYSAEVAFPGAGPFDVWFDVRRGDGEVRVARRVIVAAASPSAPAACRLGDAPCTLELGDGLALTLDLGPRPLRTMAELVVRADLRRGATPVDGARVEVGFEMAGMDMGRNVSALADAGGGRYAGKAVLVRCPSGRREWIARVRVALPDAAPRTAAADLRVAE